MANSTPTDRTHGDRSMSFASFQRPSFTNVNWPQHQLPDIVTNQPIFNPTLMSPALSETLLPDYVKPLPSRLGHDEAAFLLKKGALSLPPLELRNALLQSFVEHVDPFMPIVDIDEFLQNLDVGDGSIGHVSLLVLQAVMFTASAFVDMQYLKRAGYMTRKDARRAFYTRTRLLYDFDYETDRVSLVQALLMMTYWYESPDDQKDTWHWMGLAISTAQTIGLNRNPARLDGHRRRQWKRIAWTLLIRDRVIALGMRKVPRVSMAEFDVPMLTLEDCKTKPLPAGLFCVSSDCAVARNVDVRTSLAKLFIAQAQLALCIGRVLAALYSVSEQSMNEEGKARTSDTLVPKHEANEAAVIDACNTELDTWFESLPSEARLPEKPKSNNPSEDSAITVNRALLHMIYHTAISALHRPQASQTAFGTKLSPDAERSVEIVHNAARQTTAVAQSLLRSNLARFLPTTGVTVMLPAITSHIMDIKSPSAKTRRIGLTSFCHCIQIMARLRDIYAAADFTIRLIELAIRKANIDIPGSSPQDELPSSSTTTKKASCVEDLVAEGLRRRYLHAIGGADDQVNTPPPDDDKDNNNTTTNTTTESGIADPSLPPLPESEIPKHVDIFLSPSPSSTSSSTCTSSNPNTLTPHQPTPTTAADLDRDFESLIDPNKLGDALNFGDNAGLGLGLGLGFNGMQGESSGFTFDLDWIHNLSAGPVSEVDGCEGAGGGRVEEDGVGGREQERGEEEEEEEAFSTSRESSVPLGQDGVVEGEMLMAG
ncbi:MAG: hypothetical protein M1828_006517 [Chrysothrix sp. TS-e1954]|nr:MAG: hypothetical protein M1828_006517 [Chrysothrix sp. TS-e1954]